MARRKSWAELDKSGIPFAKLRAAFAVYNRTTNKSPQTVQWYEERLELFERFLGRRAVLAGVSVENVRAFIADLQGRTQRHANNPYVKNKEGVLSSSYIQGFARALRAFSSWLYEDGYTDTNVLRVVKPPKIQQKVVEVLKDEEVSQLLAVLDRTQTLGARDYAIVFTLLDCGLRASELCELTLDDAHIDEGYLKVLGKGNKQRLVPIGRACQDALFRWRERYRPLLEEMPSRYLFLSREGKPLTVGSLEELVDRILMELTFSRGYALPPRRSISVEPARERAPIFSVSPDEYLLQAFGQPSMNCAASWVRGALAGTGPLGETRRMASSTSSLGALFLITVPANSSALASARLERTGSRRSASCTRVPSVRSG